MTITKRAIIAISLLLVTILMAPAICAQYVTPATLTPISDYTGFDHPSAIAVDSVGNIYVTDNWASSVWKFSPTGNVITHWGSRGSGDGQFSVPAYVAIDKQDYVYIIDVNNNRIQKFSSDGMYISHWDFPMDDMIECFPKGSLYPMECRGEMLSFGGIATSLDGNLFIVDQSNNTIHKTTPDGKFLAKWGSKGKGEGQFSNPSDIAVDGEGNIFVADSTNSRIQKFSANGTFLTTWGSFGESNGQFFRPDGIGVDQRGFVYVVDSTLNRVQKFTDSGTFITKWGSRGPKDGEFALASDVAVDGNDNVYVTDFSNHRVQKFTANGSFLMKWGGSLPPMTPPILRTTITPNPYQTPRERDDGITITVSEYLAHMNDKLHWGFSDEQISQYSENLQKNLEKKYVMGENWIYISNFSRFSQDLKDSIGITEEQQLSLLYYEQKEMGYRIAYMEIPGFKSPETPHFIINGMVTDPEGRPVPDAMVKFESNLVIKKIPQNLVAKDTPLSSTTRTGTDGTYHINVAWGDRQNASVTKEGYLNYTRSGINLTNESNTIDFKLTPLARATPSTPGFLFFPVFTAIMLAWMIIVRKRH